jgi:hypothetical protein
MDFFIGQQRQGQCRAHSVRRLKPPLQREVIRLRERVLWVGREERERWRRRDVARQKRKRMLAMKPRAQIRPKRSKKKKRMPVAL